MDVTILFTFGTVFLTGIITAILPCTLPVVFGFLGILLQQTSIPKERIFRVIFFCLGFTVMYTFFGVIVGLLGYFTQSALIVLGFKQALIHIGGAFLIITGVYSLRVIPLVNSVIGNMFSSIHIWMNAHTPFSLSSTKSTTPFFMGTIFAAGWTPCIGVVLGSVLTLAGTTGTVLLGGAYLLIFSIGLSVPFLLIASGYTRAEKWFYKHTWVLRTAEFVSGVFLIAIGLVFLTGYTHLFVLLSEPFAQILPAETSFLDHI
ncbi:MAG: cytochrome c biogenesis CcdA family protein [Alphaproteobacteria bacterium]|nr:cytochrome c biogenesis CcdA family protein [Alphaproteobacteria bacterium]